MSRGDDDHEHDAYGYNEDAGRDGGGVTTVATPWAVVVRKNDDREARGARDECEQTTPGQFDSGPPTLGSVQCAQGPLETVTVTPVCHDDGFGGDLHTSARHGEHVRWRGADDGGHGAAGDGLYHHSRGGGGDVRMSAEVTAATAAAASGLLVPPRYHTWSGASSFGADAGTAEGRRDLLEAAAFRCQWQIAWLEEGNDGGGAAHSSSVGFNGLPFNRPFKEVHRAMLSVCLDANEHAFGRSGPADGASIRSGGEAARTTRTDADPFDRGDDVGNETGKPTFPIRETVLSRTDMFLSSLPSIHKLRRRSKASAGALRQCMTDAEIVSRAVVGGSRSSSLLPGSAPIACGVLRGLVGGRVVRQSPSESADTTGLLGRLLKERSEAAHSDAAGAAHDHASLLDEVNEALETMFTDVVHTSPTRDAAASASLVSLLMRLRGTVHDTLTRCYES